MFLALWDFAAAATSRLSFPFQNCVSCNWQKWGMNLFCFLFDLLTFGYFSCYKSSYKFWTFYWFFSVFERRKHDLIIKKGETAHLCWVFYTFCVSSRENFFHYATKKSKKSRIKKQSSFLIGSNLPHWGTNTNIFSAYLCTRMDNRPPGAHGKTSENSLGKHIKKKKTKTPTLF